MNHFRYLKFTKNIFSHRQTLPLQLVLFVTSRCNLKCKHCFYWERLNNPADELTIKEYELLTLNKFKLLWLCLTGGEPFLRTDLPQIVELFCKNGTVLNITIPTNGQLPEQIFKISRDIVSICSKYNTYVSVLLSVEGIGELNDAIRGKGTFEKFIETYERLLPLSKYFKNFGLGAQFTQNNLNQKEMGELYLFLKGMKFNNVTINTVRGNVKESELKNIDGAYYRYVTKLAEHSNNRAGVKYYNFPFKLLAKARNYIVYDIIAQVIEDKKYIIPCYAGTIHAVISERGEVFPCEILDKSLGNLRDCNFKFDSIWFSPQAIKIREMIRQTKCFCTYECAISANVLMNKKYCFEMIRKAFKIAIKGGI